MKEKIYTKNILIIILFVLYLSSVFYIGYSYYAEDKNRENLKIEEEYKENETEEEVLEKLEKPEKEEQITEKEEKCVQESNDYKIYLENLKNNIRNVYNDAEGEEVPFSLLQNVVTFDGEVCGYLDLFYRLEINSKGDLYLKYYGKGIEKYPYLKNKVLLYSGVLNAYTIYIGNGGCKIVYFITDEGKVGQAYVENLNNELPKVEINENLKNVVQIIQGVRFDGSQTIFIDINGNMLDHDGSKLQQ